ncbi:MAG: hypothetical protein E4H03_14300 [Myxococcales bacterium]|nr:MAG: hypothetical protein E4H03_14300 [Myxococcales bacterium]
MADVRVGGKLLTGSDGSGEDLVVDVCRLTVEPGGSIDHALRDAQSYADADNNVLIIRESMTVEAGGEIVASGIDGGKNIIRFRDPAKPPLLEGTVDPAPVLITDPSLVGCPVCGNSEIDHTESCDDGNTTSSDGCRDDCQDEGCLAESPGYPSTPLCDDGDACTIDVCDPVGHACGHITSCEEGVACTVDTCVAGACEHTADDLLCDDNDDCTADVCSPAAGCVYANLTGPACEDGDLCTQTGTCRRGACDATDKRPTTKNKIAVRLKPGAADRLSGKAQLSLETFTPDLVLTGIALELRDQDDRTVYAATVAGSEFEVSASGTRYRNATGAPGIDSVRISSVTSKGVAKVRVKAKDVELAGAADQAVMSLSFLFGLDPAVDDCLTARRVPCKSAAAKTTCK